MALGCCECDHLNLKWNVRKNNISYVQSAIAHHEPWLLLTGSPVNNT